VTITAKYAGKCSECSARFPVGAQIEWIKGGPTRCAACAAKAPAPPAQAPQAQAPQAQAPQSSGGKASSGYLPPLAGGPRRCVF